MGDSPFAFSFGHDDEAQDAREAAVTRPRTARPTTSTGSGRPSTSIGGDRGAFGGPMGERQTTYQPQTFGTVQEFLDDESDEESPFAFAPPPLAARSPLPEVPAASPYFQEISDAVDLGRQVDDRGLASASSLNPAETGDNRYRSAAFPATTLEAPHTASEISRATSPTLSQSALSPAAAFAQKVQTGAPEWIEDDGFTRDVVEPTSRAHARRRFRERMTRRQHASQTAAGQAPDSAAYLSTDVLDAGKDVAGSPIPLTAFAHSLPVTTVLEDEEDKNDLEGSVGRRATTRRRQVRTPKPALEDLEDSPYPAVQGSVSNIDDHDAVVVSFRTWVMGFSFCIVFSAINTFFSLRYPAPLITPIVTQLASYPIGKFVANRTPSAKLRFPVWLQKYGLPEHLSLNPGPFSIKEHTLLTIMVNISTQPAFGLNYTLAAEKGYGQSQSAGFDCLLILSSQVIGFGAAGLARRFLVWPAAMIWPQNLVFSTVLNTLHAELDDEEPGISRFRFFVFVIVGAFCWFWLPGFLFTALSAFSWICWMAPDNIVVNQLFGVSSGLGMGILTFDWSQISYINPPLVIPWWAQVNVFTGFAVSMWIIAPALYYSNVLDFAYLPISTTSVFDRFGEPYNTSRVIDPSGMRMNETAYATYSPIYLPAALTTSYGLQYMLATAILVHTILYHGRDLRKRLLTPHSNSAGDDVHMRLMRKYSEVPDWWFATLLLGAIGISLATVGAYDTSMPPWALLVAIVIALIYFVPGGIIFAMTGLSVSLNLLIELVAGFMMPGVPLANMLFKIYALQLNNLGLYYAQDMKLAHYQKIPPRVTFVAQLAATVATAFVQVGVKRWLVAVVPTLCDRDQSAHLTCPYARTYYSTSAIWGVIGPARLFAVGQRYHPLLYGLIIGAILPVLTWLLSRRFPRSWIVYANVPIALLAALSIPPASGINFSSALIVGFIFQYLIRHRHFEWWSKYNFLLSAGLDAGTVFSGILIFLTLQLPKGGNISLNWWGNEVYTNTADWAGTPLKTPPPQGFGPTTW